MTGILEEVAGVDVHHECIARSWEGIRMNPFSSDLANEFAAAKAFVRAQKWAYSKNALFVSILSYIIRPMHGVMSCIDLVHVCASWTRIAQNVLLL